MAGFALLAVTGYADYTETYVPIDTHGAAMSPQLTAHGLAVWLVKNVIKEVTRERWNEIGQVLSPAVKAGVHDYVANVYLPQLRKRQADELKR
jgi:hypothetical protein